MVFRGRDLELWGKMMIDCFYRVICPSIELFMYIFILGFDDMAFIYLLEVLLGNTSMGDHYKDVSLSMIHKYILCISRKGGMFSLA